MLLLNSNEDMRHFIVNHTGLYGEPGRTTNSTVADWKEAIKTSFGITYYNDMYVAEKQQISDLVVFRNPALAGICDSRYGSSRTSTKLSTGLGSVQRHLPLVQQVLNSDSLIYYSYTNDSIRYMERGQKRFELSNHLGNVLAVVTDRKLVHCSGEELMWFEAQIVSVTDYYPFGMEIRERSWSVSSYRFGFGKHEKLNELYGEGNAYDMGARLYDPRIGRTPSRDKYKHLYPGISPYAFALNNPIYFLDIDGNIIIDKNGNVVTINRDDKGNITGITAFNKKGKEISPDPFTVKMIKAVDKTDIGRQRLNQMEVHPDQFQYLEDKKGRKTGGGPAQTNTTEEKGVLTRKMYINTGYNTDGTRFHNASEEEYLNATGVHEPSHFLNPAQVNLDKTEKNAVNDPESEYSKLLSEDEMNRSNPNYKAKAPKFQYENFETEVLKDELKTREQFPNNTLDQKPGGTVTSRERYENAINSPKSSDVNKYRPNETD